MGAQSLGRGFESCSADLVARSNLAVEAVAKQANATPTRVVLAWILAQGEHIALIPGTKHGGDRIGLAQDDLIDTTGPRASSTFSPPRWPSITAR